MMTSTPHDGKVGELRARKILVVTGIFPPDHGGPATYVPLVASALMERHTVLAVLTLSDETAGTRHDDSIYAFPVIRVKRSKNKLLRVLRTIRHIHRLAGEADVVFVNGLAVQSVIACRLLRRRRVIVKIVGDWAWERARNARAVTLDIDSFQGAQLGLRWGLVRWIHRWAIRRMSGAITPSRYLARLVQGWGVPESRIAVVYNATQKVAVAQGVKTEKHYDLVTVARLVPWKGVDELCRLAAQNGWTLRVIGDGPLREELQAQVDRDGAGHLVTFEGQMPKDEVTTAMASARVFVLNSTYEGLPHVVLEAKAAGLPVVATAVGGTPETVTDGEDGFLVPAGDGGALMSRIALLLGDPQLQRRLGERGRSHIQARFSVQQMLADTESMLVNAGNGPIRTSQPNSY